MFKALRIIIKISYILLAVVVFARVFLKTAAIKPEPLVNLKDQALSFLYDKTDIIINPLTDLLLKVQQVLPESLYAFFPVFQLETTGGRLEWAGFVAIIIIITGGVLLEIIVQHLSEYEAALISVLKEVSFSTANINSNGKGKSGHTQLKKIKDGTNADNTQKENELRNVYNLIIKRLDREKTELVNKNIHLEKALITDTLTGLKTRKYLNERLKHEFHTAKVRKSPLSVIMIDIDHFKSVNDQFGHQVGDMVLKDVSQIIINHCESHMVAARYGGEEMTVICPKFTSQQALELGEKIRKSIERSLTYDKNTCNPVTISAGIATFHVHHLVDTPEALVAEADAALYEAKNAGRNRVKMTSSNPHL